jgi:hypothetical protein
MSEDPDRSVAVFNEALQHPMSERSTFLDQACVDDKDLRRKIEVLLRAHERLGSFMEMPFVGPGFPSVSNPRFDQELPKRNGNNGESNNA